MAFELTKQAIATRLLRSAVRSFLRAEDPVAVYLLGTTAARLLRDLADARGIDWLSLTMGRAIYYMALDLNDGHFEGPEEVRPLIEEIGALIASGSIEKADHIKVNEFEPQQKRETLRLLNREYNFIKHADRDPLDSISEERIDPILSVASACMLFSELFPQADLDEVTLFRYILQREAGRGYSSDVAPYASRMDEIPDDELNAALLNFLAFVEREGQ